MNSQVNNLTVSNNLTISGNINSSGNINTSGAINASSVVTDSLTCDNVTLNSSLELNSLTCDKVNMTDSIPINFLNNGVSYNLSSSHLKSLYDNAGTALASKLYVDTRFSQLIASAPSLLDDLHEIAASINNDPALYQTIMSLLAKKSDLSGNNVFTGGLNTFGNIQTQLINGIDLSGSLTSINTGLSSVTSDLSSYKVSNNLAVNNVSTALTSYQNSNTSSVNALSVDLSSYKVSNNASVNALTTSLNNYKTSNDSSVSALTTDYNAYKVSNNASVSALTTSLNNYKTSNDSSVSALTSSVNSKIGNSGSQTINGSLGVINLTLNNGTIYNSIAPNLGMDISGGSIGLSLPWNAWGRGEMTLLGLGNTYNSGIVLASSSTDSVVKIPTKLASFYDDYIDLNMSTRINNNLNVSGSTTINGLSCNGSSISNSELLLVKRLRQSHDDNVVVNFNPTSSALNILGFSSVFSMLQSGTSISAFTGFNVLNITYPFGCDYILNSSAGSDQLLTVFIPSMEYKGDELNFIFNGVTGSYTMNFYISGTNSLLYTFTIGTRYKMLKLKLITKLNGVIEFLPIFDNIYSNTNSFYGDNTFNGSMTCNGTSNFEGACNFNGNNYFLGNNSFNSMTCDGQITTSFLTGVHRPRFQYTYNNVSANDNITIDFTPTRNVAMYNTMDWTYGCPLVKLFLVYDSVKPIAFSGASGTATVRHMVPVSTITSYTGVPYYGCSLLWERAYFSNVPYYRLNVNVSGSGLAMLKSYSGVDTIASGSLMVCIE